MRLVSTSSGRARNFCKQTRQDNYVRPTRFTDKDAPTSYKCAFRFWYRPNVTTWHARSHVLKAMSLTATSQNGVGGATAAQNKLIHQLHTLQSLWNQDMESSRRWEQWGNVTQGSVTLTEWKSAASLQPKFEHAKTIDSSLVANDYILIIFGWLRVFCSLTQYAALAVYEVLHWQFKTASMCSFVS